MHKLVRQVRFSLNPFTDKDKPGFNSYVSKPTGEGLSLFFELGIELLGTIDSSTGFIVNVVDIDKKVREQVVPVFSTSIRSHYRAGKEVSFLDMIKLLGLCRQKLAGLFSPAKLSRLNLKLNPFRQIVIDNEADKMVYFSEKFEFAATHILWNNNFTDQRNIDVFGKCANPSGHGHNYIVEVTVKTPASGDFSIAEFERIIDKELIRLIDHKNLNKDVEFFHATNPTMENIAMFAWGKLAGKLNKQTLHCVTIWESERACCSYTGPE